MKTPLSKPLAAAFEAVAMIAPPTPAPGESMKIYIANEKRREKARETGARQKPVSDGDFDA